MATGAMQNYVVCTIKSWNIEAFGQMCPDFPGRWHLIQDKEALTPEGLEAIKPRYIFFPHWSWIVPDAILSNYECVCFHMTDVPYGRGGSPLQNLIARGHKETVLTALRMTEVLDAGPVYDKRPLSLAGTAESILKEAGIMSMEMARDIAEKEPDPIEQTGEVTVFKRRTPDMSELPHDTDLEKIYDHIRMLDAEGYPHAFIDHGKYRIEFTGARFEDGEVSANVKIKIKEST